MWTLPGLVLSLVISAPTRLRQKDNCQFEVSQGRVTEYRHLGFLLFKFFALSSGLSISGSLSFPNVVWLATPVDSPNLET